MQPQLAESPGLSIEEELKLQEFLDELELDRHWVTGMLTAVLTGPEVVAPSTWIPELASKAKFTDANAAQTGFELVLRLYNDVAQKLAASPKDLCPEGSEPEAVNAFCSGYVRGANMHPLWRKDESAFLLVFVFAAVAGEVGDELLRDSEDKPLDDPEGWRQKHRERVAEYVTELRDYWKSVKIPVRRAETKVGRNDPCPCGSGKKSKKCCAK